MFRLGHPSGHAGVGRGAKQAAHREALADSTADLGHAVQQGSGGWTGAQGKIMALDASEGLAERRRGRRPPRQRRIGGLIARRQPKPDGPLLGHRHGPDPAAVQMYRVAATIGQRKSAVVELLQVVGGRDLRALPGTTVFDGQHQIAPSGHLGGVQGLYRGQRGEAIAGHQPASRHRAAMAVTRRRLCQGGLIRPVHVHDRADQQGLPVAFGERRSRRGQPPQQVLPAQMDSSPRRQTEDLRLALDLRQGGHQGACPIRLIQGAKDGPNAANQGLHGLGS